MMINQNNNFNIPSCITCKFVGIKGPQYHCRYKMTLDLDPPHYFCPYVESDDLCAQYMIKSDDLTHFPF